jgi:septal ring factor EnvC (AmiA/AmiB activator)
MGKGGTTYDKHVRRIVTLLALSSIALVRAADSDPTTDQKKELATIRQQVSQYEKELQKRSRDEAAALNFLADLDKEIDFTQRYVRSMSADLSRLERQISERQDDIGILAAEQEKLRQLIRERVVRFYKHHRLQDLEVLFSVRSWEQLRAWMKYERLIADNDRRNLQALQERERALQRQRNLWQIELTEKERKVRDKQLEENNLQVSKDKRQQFLKEIRRDKSLLAKRLQEIKESEKQISALIAAAEKARLSQKATATKKTVSSPVVAAPMLPGHFGGMKGRLPWPTRGPVISHFGRERHPELNTITENLGIEIQARLGSPVTSVGDGIVQTITWQRGRGNIIIISHDDGYYTVYTHLQDIQVEELQTIKQGQIIGSVGDSGSLHGPILHFQIWKNTVNLDPEDWLA